MKHEWARANPVRDVTIPSDAEAVRMHVLTRAEEMSYFQAARRYPNLYDLGRIMIRQGMRPDEVMGLEQANIDLEKGALFIPRGKSRAARRTLDLAPNGEIAAILRHRLNGERWVFSGKKIGHAYYETEQQPRQSARCHRPPVRHL